MYRTLPHLIAAGLLGAAALAAQGSGPIGAKASVPVYVDDTGVADPGGSGACGAPNYTLIQAAVDDLAAAHIIVCAGTYTEQIRVARSATLEGQPGAVIQAPAALNQPYDIVAFSGSQQSSIGGFSITGASTTDAQLYAGISVRNGAQVEIRGNQVSDIRGLSLGSVQGAGVYITEAQAVIAENSIERYGNVGILLFWAGTTAAISSNSVRGQGPAGADEVQVGIEVREDAAATVEYNTVTGNVGTFPAPASAGILVAFTGNVSVRHNDIQANQRGIVLGNVGGAEVRGNQAHNNTSHGILMLDTLNTTVAENSVDGNGEHGITLTQETFDNMIVSNSANGNGADGISLAQGVTGNSVTQNSATANSRFDLEDSNGEPLPNAYSANICLTSNPAGLCASANTPTPTPSATATPTSTSAPTSRPTPAPTAPSATPTAPPQAPAPPRAYLPLIIR
jgi:parallel beta-helix repeat protein